MTRRDYVLLSGVCARHSLPHDFIVDLCNALYMQNYNFDTEQFLKVIQKEGNNAESV
jgi:hypothetical protein